MAIVSKQVNPVSLVNDVRRFRPKVLVQLPSRLGQFVLAHGSVELSLKFFPFPYSLQHDHELVFIFIVSAIARVAFRVSLFIWRIFAENPATLLNRIIFLPVILLCFLRCVTSLLLLLLSLLFLHYFIIHFPNCLAFFARCGDSVLFESFLLLFADLLDVLLPR